MHACVGEDGIPDAVLAIESAEQKSDTTIKQEATKDNNGAEAKHQRSSGKVSCCKKHCRDNICPHQLCGGWSILARELHQDKCDKRHKKQAKHHFLYHTAVGKRGDNVFYSRLYKIAVLYSLRNTREEKRVGQNKAATAYNRYRSNR